MLAESLKSLITDSSVFLQRIYPDRKTDIGQKTQYDNHFRKFSLCQSLLLPLKERLTSLSKLHSEINIDILERKANNMLAEAELKSIPEIYNNNKTAVIALKQVQRFADKNYKCKPKDINVLLVYLEIPISDWRNYYNSTEQKQEDKNKEDKINESNIKIRPDLLTGSWNGYFLNPDADKKIYQVPFYFEKISEHSFYVFMKGVNKEMYQGNVEIVGNYLVGIVINERKTNAISLQAYVNAEMLQHDCILNTACIWVQYPGKPVLSIIILYKSKRHFKKNQLPDLEIKEIKISHDINIQRVNQIIEYLSRKNIPELAARWFKPNTLEGLKKRNSQSNSITLDFRIPREEFINLAAFFTKPVGQGQWWSFSRIHSDLSQENKRVSVFQWSFKAFKNRRIIEVTRVSRLSDEEEYNGIIQYKQNHVSIYFTSQDGFKHYLCPLAFSKVKTDYEKSKGLNPDLALALPGSSSTLHEDCSYLVKEMLVYTDKLDKKIIKDGFIPLEEFLNFEFLDQEHKDYLSNRDEAVYYNQSAF